MTIIQETALQTLESLREALLKERAEADDPFLHPGIDVAISYIDTAIQHIKHMRQTSRDAENA